ncbi:hypothetical protein [Bdellovibrio sp. BCCA]|uniref:hypothetical protein n=1 Tax=Bdellovibrio sp. BCCA TaxID=3136281 RepID=UPI0030F27BB7
MKKRNLYFLLIVIAVGILFLILGDDDFQEKWVPPSVRKSVSKNIAITADTASQVQGGSSEGNEAANVPKVSAVFIQWFENEARDMEKSSIDPKVKEAQLKEAVQKMEPFEVQFLKDTSLNMKESANNRILAVYLLTLAPEVTSGALGEIVETPLAMQGEHPVHSPEETLAAQEKSLRRMAIDSLIEQARKDELRHEQVKNIISQITDRSLREYAERSFTKLK